MVQNDAQSTCLVLFVTPAFIDLSDVSIFVGEGHPAHPHGDITLNETGSRFRNNGTPAFDAKPYVTGVLITVTHKIRKRTVSRGAKGLFPAG
jgi:hypothetical protein